MHNFNIGDIRKTEDLKKQIEADRNETVPLGPNFGHLAGFQVDSIESMLTDKKISPELPFVVNLYNEGKTARELWGMFCNSHWEMFGARHAFGTALNALLCDARTKDRVFTEIIAGLSESSEFITASLKALAYYNQTHHSEILNKLNQCRMSTGELISPTAINALKTVNLTPALFYSAARCEDVEAFHYLLDQLDPAYTHEQTARQHARAVSASASFLRAALRGRQTIHGFAEDVLETVKSANLRHLDTIYDPVLLEQCSHELLLKLMSMQSLSPRQTKAAQHFMGRVIASGIDTYRTFLVQAYSPFMAVDKLKFSRMTGHQIVDRILRLYTISTGNLDIFLLGVDVEDIRTHSNSEECFDRLHKLTGDNKWLIDASNSYKGKQLEDLIGL